MNRVLVTGSEGFLGRSVCRKLEVHGYEVVRFDKQLGQNVLEESHVKSVLRNGTAVIHLGAPCSALMFLESPQESWNETVSGMKNILEYCSGRIVLPSTCTVYGESRDPALEDRELPPPPNLYAAAKRECEKLCFLKNITGGDIKVLRIFTGYGPGEWSKGKYASPMMHFIQDILAGRQPKIYGDGTQVRDFIFIDDVVEFIVNATKTESKEVVFNVGTGRGTSLLAVLDMIKVRLGSNIQPEFVELPDGYVGSIVADISRAMKELKYSARTDVEEGISKTIKRVRCGE
jgi:UDP-glucose 4-epimerase